MNNSSRRSRDLQELTSPNAIRPPTLSARPAFFGLCAAACLWLAPEGASAQGRLDAQYEATLAGIPVGKGAWTIEIGDDTFSAAAQGGTAGLLKAFSGGTGYAFDETYFVLGLGASYYLIDGLNVGLHVESWSGADPGMTKITPSVQYVFHQIRTVKPYVGAFYRRTDIERLEDLDSWGGRAGVYIQAARNAFIGLGAVYESYLDCNKTTYRSCDSTYAEVSLTFAF